MPVKHKRMPRWRSSSATGDAGAVNTLGPGRCAVRIVVPNGPAQEPEMAPLPAGWGETLTGAPMPDVAAAVRRLAIALGAEPD